MKKDLFGLGDPLLIYKLRTRLILFITQLESYTQGGSNRKIQHSKFI